MRSEITICAPPRLLEVFPMLPLKRFQCFKEDRPASLHASLLQVIDDVMSLALCQHVVPQAPQHFRYSKTQATFDGCFSRLFPPVFLLGHFL